MIHNRTLAVELANQLLKIDAIKLSPSNPYTWASGRKSPIYCDNRVTLSFPEVRNLIRNGFSTIIKEQFSDVECIAGVATGGIAHGALVADILNLPFIYVREKPKAHGRQNQVEGFLPKGQKVVVIEDLISTGGSSINAINALREADANVLGLIAIFDYGFPDAAKNYSDTNCLYSSLSDFPTLIETVEKENSFSTADIDFMKEWYKE